jgi:hypothetical protein
MLKLAYRLTATTVALMLGAACGSAAPATDPPPDAAPSADAVAPPPPLDDLQATTVGTLGSPQGMAGLALAALDEHHVLVARADAAGTAFCPDCAGPEAIPPDQCPDACKRTVVTLAVATIEGDSATLGAPLPVHQEYPLSFDHRFRSVQVVSLGEGRAGVSWLECDDSSCGWAKLSCTAKYTTVDLADGHLGPVQVLYEKLFGDLELAYDEASHQLLAVLGNRMYTGVGVRVATFDESGAVQARPWTPLGGPATRSPSVTVTPTGFVVVADDHAPSVPAAATPCAVSCDCLDSGPIDIANGGLFAYRIPANAADPVSTERIALGVDADHTYGDREENQVIPVGAQLLVAAGQSVDRYAEIFSDDGGWQPLLRSPAPPVPNVVGGIGALGTVDHSAWLGLQDLGAAVPPRRLVAGVVRPTGSQVSPLADPIDGFMLQAAPVLTPRGVTTTFLLQGILGPPGSPDWGRLDLVRVSARWPDAVP